MAVLQDVKAWERWQGFDLVSLSKEQSASVLEDKDLFQITSSILKMTMI